MFHSKYFIHKETPPLLVSKADERDLYRATLAMSVTGPQVFAASFVVHAKAFRLVQKAKGGVG